MRTQRHRFTYESRAHPGSPFSQFDWAVSALSDFVFQDQEHKENTSTSFQPTKAFYPKTKKCAKRVRYRYMATVTRPNQLPGHWHRTIAERSSPNEARCLSQISNTSATARCQWQYNVKWATEEPQFQAQGTRHTYKTYNKQKTTIYQQDPTSE